jgi:YgiT-type zinc finger domain-containing protein
VSEVIVDKVYTVLGRKVRVKDIPMRICAACGERFLDARASEHVERALGLVRRRKKHRAA